MKTFKAKVITSVTATLLFSFSELSLAQTGETAVEEVIVTGSRLARGSSEDAPQPVDVFQSEDLAASGGASVQDFLFDLPTNVGSEASPNIFNQNFNAGTEGVNFRGLGLSSTLVLINGQRAPLSSALSHDGSTFVDTSTIPKIFVERVEILKDGGSAIYGSEAIAGVANFILRKRFEGVEIQGGYQSTFENSQTELDFGIIAGKNLSDSTNITVGVNYFERDPLAASDREFTTPTSGVNGFSAAGQPGNFVLGPFGGPPGLTPDPGCVAGGGTLAGLCLFNFIQFAELVIPEKRLHGIVRLDHSFDNNIEAFAEVLIAKNKVDGQTLPLSTPTVGGFIPTTNPGFPTVAPFDTVAGAVFIGRPFGNNAPAGIIDRTNDTLRISAGLKGDLDSDWGWDINFQHGENEYEQNFPDVFKSRFFAALAGAGGSNNNEFFNPFGSAESNSQGVIDSIATNYGRAGETSLATLEATVNGDLFDMPTGAVGVALGVQLRSEELEADFNAAAETFDLGFLVGGNDYKADRDIYAVFAELGVPLTETIELQLAARYEDYEGFGSSFDPKVAVGWTPSDIITLRFSYATAFRTPSLQQAFGNQVGVFNFQVPSSGPNFQPLFTTGNTNLENEESESVNIGVILTPSDDIRIALDYFSFDYENLITVENPLDLFNAFLAAGSPANNVSFRDVLGGTSQVVTTNGVFSGVSSNFVNAGSQKVNGLDLSIDFGFDTGMGRVDISSNTAYFTKFDIQTVPGGPTIDALGQRNIGNFARTLPKFRSNNSVSLSTGLGQFSLNSRFTDGFNNEQAVGNPEVASHKEVDLLYNVDFLEGNISLSIGILNVFDEEPPFVETPFNFDSQVHDPRGRIGYLRIKYSL